MRMLSRIRSTAIWLATIAAVGSVIAASPARRPATGEKVLRHVVLFRYKEGTTPER